MSNCPSQCTNQRRFMTSPLVIQIYACIILHFILKFHHWQRYTWHSGVIAVYQPTPFYDFTFSDKYSSICLGWKRPKVQILSNSVSFGSLTYSKTCVLSITGALAGWEHVLIGFQHIHNRELESRNKSKLPFILMEFKYLHFVFIGASARNKSKLLAFLPDRRLIEC